MGTTATTTLFCRCPACKREFLVDKYTSSPRFTELLEDADVRNMDKPKLTRIWEERCPVQHVETLEKLPEGSVSEFYREAVAALAHGLPNAAGAMFRKTLEAMTVDTSLLGQIPSDQREAYKGRSLYQRIDALKEVDAIPRPLHALADIVRTEGNLAIHSTESFRPEEAEALKSFTDAFLMQTAILPTMMAAARSNKKAKDT
jgi:hypothetical protein